MDDFIGLIRYSHELNSIYKMVALAVLGLLEKIYDPDESATTINQPHIIKLNKDLTTFVSRSFNKCCADS